MNSFILSAIVTHITGETMFEYLSGKLFAPMGIRKVFWEVSPTGITKAGWGMFITQEDAAKLELTVSAGWRLERTTADFKGMGTGVCFSAD